MNRLLAAVLAVAALSLTAGPALAGSADCIYLALPKAQRVQVDEAYDHSLREGLESSFYSQEGLAEAVESCVPGLDLTARNIILKSLAGREFETQTTRWFLKRPGVTRDGLDAAWAAIDPAILARARVALEADDSVKGNAVLRGACPDFLARLGMPALQEYIDYAKAYMIGRLAREMFETVVGSGPPRET